LALKRVHKYLNVEGFSLICIWNILSKN
jgi:hypothetical protein